ncbi:uncharacterized protein DDB_G0283357 [Episyrphus balteatus]|uniref:uncharacterized protein DDB_G0283357 n=1 Tax=Episyrphus balteatus TaxID=286459 RepID=UPI002485C86B|nr:uncharacterized protein DDB_G0283357 [Episyrphus balteatus]
MLSYMLPVEEKPSETTITTTTTTTTAMTVSPPSMQVDASNTTIQSLQVQKTPVSIVKGSTAPTNNQHHSQEQQQQQYQSSQTTTTTNMMNVGGRNLNLNLNLSNKLNQSGNALLSAIIEKNTTTTTSSSASALAMNSNSSIASDDNDDDGCHSFDNCDENTKLLDASEKICANGKTLASVTAAVAASVADTSTSSAICLHGSNHNSNNKTAIRSNSNGNNNNNNSISSSLKGGGGSSVGNSSSCHDCIEEEEVGDTCDEDTETGGTSDGDRRKQLKKVKLSKIGATKSVTLKRVSFGSSKGSMVETLVFETPTPLPEHAEREFGFSIENSYNTGVQSICNNNINSACSRINSSLDDSGIELQEELERSKVRVSIYQSNQPQQVSPPESYSHFKDNSYLLISDTFSTEPSDFENDIMTAVTATPTSYDRQQSTDSGWDNPFRPGGDLSREADEIVNMIKGGKPITPTGDINHAISNGSAQKESHSIENGTAVVDGATKIQVAQSQSAQNGTHSPQLRPATTTTTTTSASPANGVSDTNGTTTQTQVSNKVVPGPTSASHVVIDDKKNKKKGCCVIQ